jgi:hypothetical protein
MALLSEPSTLQMPTVALTNTLSPQLNFSWAFGQEVILETHGVS